MCQKLNGMCGVAATRARHYINPLHVHFVLMGIIKWEKNVGKIMVDTLNELPALRHLAYFKRKQKCWNKYRRQNLTLLSNLGQCAVQNILTLSETIRTFV